MRSVPQAAIDLVKASEGLRLAAYQNRGDVPTIGWGSTKGVKLGMVITLAEAEERLMLDFEVASNRLARVIDPAILTTLLDSQYAALLDFVLNVGADPKWQIWQVIRNRRFDQVPTQLSRFVYASGRILPGLVKRRKAEGALWLSALPPKPPAPVVGLQAPVMAVLAPAVIVAAHTHSPFLPIVAGLALACVLIWLTFLTIRSRTKPMPSQEFDNALAALVSAFNARVAAAGNTEALDAANARITDLESQLATAQGAASQVDADDTAAVVAATPA